MANILADDFLDYLKRELDNPALSYKSSLEKIEGGFETSIYRFQLQNSGDVFSRPLILRLYPAFYGTGNAIRESIVQNALHQQGYPAARVHLLCTDMSLLGGAFFVMDILPGRPMINAPGVNIPACLGKAHAQLHNLTPQPLVNALVEAGLQEAHLHFDYNFRRLREKSLKYPWIREAADWMIANVPPEPQEKVICHGDFHPLNILVDGNEVTGVLDWPGFRLADPAMDMAITLMLLTIPYKYLAPVLRPELKDVDFDLVASKYVDAYKNVRSIDESHLTYYRTGRCIDALIEGMEGQESWRHPVIVKEICFYIHSTTGVIIQMPDR